MGIYCKYTSQFLKINSCNSEDLFKRSNKRKYSTITKRMCGYKTAQITSTLLEWIFKKLRQLSEIFIYKKTILTMNLSATGYRNFEQAKIALKKPTKAKKLINYLVNFQTSFFYSFFIGEFSNDSHIAELIIQYR